MIRLRFDKNIEKVFILNLLSSRGMKNITFALRFPFGILNLPNVSEKSSIKSMRDAR